MRTFPTSITGIRTEAGHRSLRGSPGPPATRVQGGETATSQVFDILPALKDGDSLVWGSMPGTGAYSLAPYFALASSVATCQPELREHSQPTGKTEKYKFAPGA